MKIYPLKTHRERFSCLKKNMGIFSLLFTLLFALWGCKPTEKGYQAAYDAALNKREANQALQSDPSALQGETVRSIDGPQLREINGEKVYVASERIKAFDTDNNVLKKYNVAVSCYKMPTNCRAQVVNLREEGKEAYGVRSGDEKFYVIEAGFESLDEAVAYAIKLKEEKDRNFIGLPGAPVILRK